METLIYHITQPYDRDPGFQAAVTALRSGSVVVFPTETVYGIGADARSTNACQKIFEAKQRPADNPLIVHLADITDLETYATVQFDYVSELMHRFSPGPVTYVLRKTDAIPDLVTAGQDTVCIRVPSHPVAHELIRQAGFPIAAPSANISTRPSATTASDAYDDLAGHVPVILSSEIEPLGIESTIIDCTSSEPQVLRYGPLTQEQIEEVVPVSRRSDSSALRTPGSHYKHYAPNLTLIAVCPEPIHLERMKQQFTEDQTERKAVRILSYFPVPTVPEDIQIVYNNSHAFMQQMFREFRNAERDGIESLYVLYLPDSEIGKGLNERIKKASTREL